MARPIRKPALAARTRRVVRPGGRRTIFTIGYQRRSARDLIDALREAGVEHLADVRNSPVSRRADFRAAAVRALCEDAGIAYGAWPQLGATKQQRDRLKATGDLPRFRRTFRLYASRRMAADLDRLARLTRTKTVALLCYERAHEECHRGVIADMLADRINASIIALE